MRYCWRRFAAEKCAIKCKPSFRGASEASEPGIHSPCREYGFRACAKMASRNDADKFQQTRQDTVSPSRGAKTPELCWMKPSEKQRAQGKPGARCTRSLVRKAESTRVSHHRFTGIITRPSLRNGFNGFLRALVSAKSARMCERAVLNQPPVAGSEPVRAQRPESLTGSVGQIRCLPQPEQLHGLGARTEQGRELDDGTR